MAKFNQKLGFISLVIVLLAFGLSGLAFVPEIEYPTIPGAPTPTEETTLPEYVKYLFNFSVILGGILAFVALVLGGFLYLASAGSPEMVGEAKSRMLSGIIGLALLLCSYIILTTINPQLVIFGEMEPLKPVTGICLCEGDCTPPCSGATKLYYASDVPEIKNLNATTIRFISDSDELSSVFIYDDKGYQGNIKEIPNTGAGSEAGVANVKSIYFFWNRPGIYLYEKTDFCDGGGYNCSKWPRHYSSSIANLDEWNKKIQSIMIKHPQKEEILMGAILFTGPGYEGRCGLIIEDDPGIIVNRASPVPNLSVSMGIGQTPNYCPSIGNNELSSLHLFTMDISKTYPGDVTFYDEINCKGNEMVVMPTIGFWLGGFAKYVLNSATKKYEYKFAPAPGDTSMDKRVLSFRINGSYRVVLLNESWPGCPAVAPADLKCQGHWEKDTTGCVNSIQNSTVYSSTDPNKNPSSVIIITEE